MNTEEKYMRAALKEADKARKIDEVPVGAVVVRDGKIIARAHNLREHNGQAMAHAEMLAIQKSSKKLGTWCLSDCDLYVTLEPCMMCTGIISLARIRTLCYGTPDPKGGATESLIRVKEIRHIGTYPKEICSGLLQVECAAVLQDFFREKRALKKQQKTAANLQ